MRFEERWTARADPDGDRVVPATHRAIAPWDSVLAANGRQPAAQTPPASIRFAGHEVKAEGARWPIQALMGHYND